MLIYETRLNYNPTGFWFAFLRRQRNRDLGDGVMLLINSKGCF